MAAFEDLQILWKKQPVRHASSLQAAAIAAAFRRHGRRHDFIYLGKLSAVILQMTILTVYLRHRPFMLFGACLAVFSALLFLIHDWRDQRAAARLDFTNPSTEFLHHALDRLNALRDPFHTREFYIALAGSWAGVNIMLAGDWVGHALALPMPYLVYRFARFVRARRFARESQPLVDRLTALLHSLEGGLA